MKYQEIPKHIKCILSLSPDVFEQQDESVQQELLRLATIVYIQETEKQLASLNLDKKEYEEVDFFAVGMRFRGSHTFKAKDKIKLEKEDENLYDKNAIKILVQTSENKWEHAAYVAKKDAKKLRNIENFENYEIVFKENFPASCKLGLIVEK